MRRPRSRQKSDPRLAKAEPVSAGDQPPSRVTYQTAPATIASSTAPTIG